MAFYEIISSDVEEGEGGDAGDDVDDGEVHDEDHGGGGVGHVGDGAVRVVGGVQDGGSPMHHSAHQKSTKYFQFEYRGHGCGHLYK